MEKLLLDPSLIILAGCSLRGGEDREQLLRLRHKTIHLAFLNYSRLDQKFEPEYALIDLLYHYSNFCDELGLGTRAANCSVVGGNGCARPQCLLAYNSSFLGLGQRSKHSDDADGKELRPLSELLELEGFDIFGHSIIRNPSTPFH
jgi:hypothetical protein